MGDYARNTGILDEYVIISFWYIKKVKFIWCVTIYVIIKSIFKI